TPGRIFDAEDLPPFTLTLDDFKAEYLTEGEKRGQATDFNAAIRYRPAPDAAERSYDLRINHPLNVGGTKVYLLGHGYAPEFTVRAAEGEVALRDARPFLARAQRNLASEGVVRAPDRPPERRAFYGT